MAGGVSAWSQPAHWLDGCEAGCGAGGEFTEHVYFVGRVVFFGRTVFVYLVRFVLFDIVVFSECKFPGRCWFAVVLPPARARSGKDLRPRAFR